MVSQDTVSGANPTFTGIVLTVGCTITAVASPTSPVQPTWSLTYNIFDAPLIIDLSTIDYPQTPLCGRVVSETFSWPTFPATGTTPLEFDAANPELVTVGHSNDQSMHDVYTVTMVNTIIHADGIFTPTITFDITILDPCKTTVLNAVSLATLSVTNGEVQSITFAESTDTVEIAKQIDTICGLRTHAIVDQGNGDAPVDWVTIVYNEDEPKTYTITATPTDEALHEGTHNFELWTTLDDYYPADHAGRRDALTVVVSATPCDCTGILWLPPALETYPFDVAGGTY